MAEVNQTNKVDSSYYYDNRPKREPVKELDKNAFLQLMIEQLKSQDPTSPMDTDQFVNQMAQFTMMEQMTNLNSSTEKLYSIQQFSYGSSLLGCEVTIANLENPEEPISGRVQKVTMSSEGVLVWLGDSSEDLKPYYLQQVTSVAQGATNGTGELTDNVQEPGGSSGSETATDQQTEPTPESEQVGEEQPAQ